MADEPADLKEEYRLRFEGMAEYRKAVWQRLTREFFQRYVPEHATVLDVGCGWGEFINNVQAGQKYAIDANPDAPARLAPGVHFLSQDCSLPWPLQDESVDVVFSSNFFEHLQDKAALKRTLQEAHRVCRRGGKIICVGPNIRCIPGAYWDFWDHYLPLSDLSMAEVLALVGFVVEERVARFLPYSMSQGSRPPLMLISLYLKMRFAWPLFGKQFLVIAQK